PSSATARPPLGPQNARSVSCGPSLPAAGHGLDTNGRVPSVRAFQTVIELRYGALRANCGELRRRRLERDIAQVTVVRLMTRWQWSAPISAIGVNGSNDSKVPLGANRDRHENLGEGTIGPAGGQCRYPPRPVVPSHE